MNYYERHIGDYLKDTAHLSLLEHGVYGRLLDVYYTREAPIQIAQVERLVGARSKEERAALASVLDEFFTVDADCLRHRRCDAEIERYQDKQRKAKASANARWTQSERNANALPTQSEGNAPSLQTPDTRPKKSIARGSRMPTDWEPDEAGKKFASELGLLRSELDKFRDYWVAQPGQKGVKLDWPAVWRNWCRNAKPTASVAAVTVASKAAKQTQAYLASQAIEPETPEQRAATAQRLRDAKQNLISRQAA